MATAYQIELHTGSNEYLMGGRTVLADVSFDKNVVLKELSLQISTASSSYGYIYVRVYDQNGVLIGSSAGRSWNGVFSGWFGPIELSEPVTLQAGVIYSIGVYVQLVSGIAIQILGQSATNPHEHQSIPDGVSLTHYGVRNGSGDVLPSTRNTNVEYAFRLGFDAILNNPPNVPTNLNHSDNGGQPRLTWTFTDPDEGDTQSRFQVQIERFDGSSWVLHHDSGQVTSSNAYYDIPASARLSANTQYRFRVMTWDAQGASSPWSEYHFWTTDRPFVSSGTWTTPPIYVGREWATLPGTVSWSATVPPGTSLTCSYRVSFDGVTWTKWLPLYNGGSAPTVNYIQLQFTLQTNYELVTPELHDVTISYPAEYAPNGEWISESITSFKDRLGDVFVDWQEVTPPGTSVVVEASLNEGQTWTPVSKGGTVPGISPNTPSLRLRVRLSTENPTATPQVSGLTVKVGAGSSKPPFIVRSNVETQFSFQNSLRGWSPIGPVYGRLERESDAYKLDGSKVSRTTNNGISSIGVFDSDTLLVFSGSEVYKTSISNRTFSKLASNLPEAATWSFTTFKGNYTKPNLIAASDFVYRFDGSTFSEITANPAPLKYITTYANRLFGAFGHTIYFSALSKAEDWNTANDSGQIGVETAKGGDITGLHPGLGGLVIFKRNSMHELYGTGPSTFGLQTVSAQVGCVSHHSIVALEGTLLWLGADGIYEYRGGSAPSRTFSLAVQGYVDRITKGYEHRACAATDGKRYYLALPIDGDTDPKIILEYDPTFQTWFVWHAPARVLSMASVGGVLYIGLEDGRILYLDPEATSDGGEAIPWVWESPPIGSGSYTTRKRWYDMWLVVDLPQGSSLNVYLSPKAEGEDSWTMVRSLTASSDMQSVRVILPVNTIANANWARVRLVGTGPAKVHELAYRERILPI